MADQTIEIYDTTLRDGTQGTGFSLTSDDKVAIAKRLDVFGVDVIEGGWPGSNPKDADFFEQMKSVKLGHARLAAFGMTRRKGGVAEARRQPQCAFRRGHTYRYGGRQIVDAPCDRSARGDAGRKPRHDP